MTVIRSTLVGYRVNLRRHILPFFGPLRIDEIALPHVREFVKVLLAKKLAPGSVRHAVALVKETTLDRYGHLMPQIHEAEARKLDRLVFGRGPVLGEVESVMPHGSPEADALQRLQNGHRDDGGVSGGNR